MRKIIVASPAANKAKQIDNFEGRTWGQLKNHPIVQELMVGSVEAIVNPGNLTLNREDAVLPEGDFKLYLVPTKNKAGNDAATIGEEITAAITKNIENSNKTELTELKNKLLTQVDEFFSVDLASAAEEANLPEVAEIFS